MRLDIGCGPKKLEGFIGMDRGNYPGVDIIQDLEAMPWPIASGSVTHINASHVLEHIKPWKIMDVMNELWRVAAMDCEMEIRTPYGEAFRFDPTHCIHFIAPSWFYFDPSHKLYQCYQPKPWVMVKAEDNAANKELYVILRKVSDERIPEKTVQE